MIEWLKQRTIVNAWRYSCETGIINEACIGRECPEKEIHKSKQTQSQQRTNRIGFDWSVFTFSYHWFVTFGCSISHSLAHSFPAYVFVSLSVDVSYLRWLYLSIFIAAPVCACVSIWSCFMSVFLPSRLFFFKHLIAIKYNPMLDELNCVRVSNFILNCDQSQLSQHENYLIMVLIVELYFTSFFEHIHSFIFCDNWESSQFFAENIFFYLNITAVLFLFFVIDVLLLYPIFFIFVTFWHNPFVYSSLKFGFHRWKLRQTVKNISFVSLFQLFFPLWSSKNCKCIFVGYKSTLRSKYSHLILCSFIHSCPAALSVHCSSISLIKRMFLLRRTKQITRFWSQIII